MLTPGTLVVHNKGFIARVESCVGADEYVIKSTKDGSRYAVSSKDFTLAEPGPAQGGAPLLVLKTEAPDAAQQNRTTSEVAGQPGGESNLGTTSTSGASGSVSGDEPAP